MPQRHDQALDVGVPLGSQQAEQVALFDHPKVIVLGFLLARTLERIRRVVVLPRIQQLIEILELDRGATFVEQFQPRLPGGTVVEVVRRLKVVHRFLIAGRRLAFADARFEVIEGQPQRFDSGSLDLDRHSASLPSRRRDDPR